MSDSNQPADPADANAAIEAALASSARGRRFLQDYARQARSADGRAVLDAISRLEKAVASPAEAGIELARLRDEFGAMRDTIGRTRSEVAELVRRADRGGALFEASETLEGIARTTELSTSAILDATEHIQETAWKMRESGFEAALCDRLDRRATDIYAACVYQDLTAQSVARLVRSLGWLEARLDQLTRGRAIESGSQSAPSAGADVAPLSQKDIDVVIVGAAVSEGLAPRRADAIPEASDAAPARPAAAAAADLEALDALSIDEKLRLFS